MLTKRDNGCRSCKKKIWIIGILLLAVVVGFFGYWLVIAPKVAANKPWEVYQGVERYTEETYLTYESGKDFQYMLQELGVAEKGEPEEFYYWDGCARDNLLYGKESDVYVLETPMGRADYSKARNNTLENAVHEQEYDDYIVYALPQNANTDRCTWLIGLCSETFTVRYIMVTETDDAEMAHRQLKQATELDWEAKFVPDPNITYYKEEDFLHIVPGESTWDDVLAIGYPPGGILALSSSHYMAYPLISGKTMCIHVGYEDNIVEYKEVRD